MRRVSAIPEDIELDMGDSAAPDGQDLRMLLDELKDVISRERPGERALANSARELTRMAGTLRDQAPSAIPAAPMRPSASRRVTRSPVIRTIVDDSRSPLSIRV